MERKPPLVWSYTDVDVDRSINVDDAQARTDFFEEVWDGHERAWSTPVSRVSTVHDIALLCLEGEIGIPEFHYVEKLIESLADKGFAKFVVSFGAVEHLNYRVFQQFMKMAKRLRRHSGDLRFVEINPYLFHIFLFTGADQTIDCFATVQEGVLSFHNTHGRHWH